MERITEIWQPKRLTTTKGSPCRWTSIFLRNIVPLCCHGWCDLYTKYCSLVTACAYNSIGHFCQCTTRTMISLSVCLLPRWIWFETRGNVAAKCYIWLRKCESAYCNNNKSSKRRPRSTRNITISFLQIKHNPTNRNELRLRAHFFLPACVCGLDDGISLIIMLW